MVQDAYTQRFIELLKSDARFKLETYQVVNEALLYANDQKQKEEDAPMAKIQGVLIPLQGTNQVSGRELCRAVCDYAVLQYGRMARHVLNSLGIRKTSDIGDVVYNLIGIGYMNKTDEDSREDFDDVFDLGKELDAGFVFRETEV